LAGLDCRIRVTLPDVIPGGPEFVVPIQQMQKIRGKVSTANIFSVETCPLISLHCCSETVYQKIRLLNDPERPHHFVIFMGQNMAVPHVGSENIKTDTDFYITL